MRRLFLLALFLCSICVACEPVENNTIDKSSNLTITSSRSVNVGCGTVIGIIYYTIETLSEATTVSATADVDWVTSLDCSTYGTIVFYIARNDSAESRMATVTVTYEDESYNVVITQAGITPDTVVEAPMVTGHYYGKIATPINNYYLCFTDKGLDSNNLTQNPDTYYYFVDLFLDAEPVDENFRVPDGTYTYDISSGESGTFAYFSWYQENDYQGVTSLRRTYTDGTLVVDGDRLTLTVTLEPYDGRLSERHVVTYEGDYALVDMRI